MKFRRLAAAALTALVLTSVAAAPASAADRTGTRVSGPSGACSNAQASNTHVTVCYQASGDYLYVKDGEADGRSAYGYFHTFSRDHCRNPHGAGTWARCNYDIPENFRIIYQGYTSDNEGIFNRKQNFTNEANEYS